jgi:hypothetical protein
MPTEQPAGAGTREQAIDGKGESAAERPHGVESRQGPIAASQPLGFDPRGLRLKDEVGDVDFRRAFALALLAIEAERGQAAHIRAGEVGRCYGSRCRQPHRRRF